MSGYGFSTDDDVANVGAFTSPYATDPSKTILPNNIAIDFGGDGGLPQTQQWYPGVPWGTVQTTGKVSTNGVNAFVTLTPGQIIPYYQVIPVTPGQSGAAYVIGPGIPTGTTVNIRGITADLQIKLNVPKGETVTPSGGTVDLTFSGKPMKAVSSSPLPISSPLPTSSPPPTSSPLPTSSPASIFQELVQLAEDGFIRTIDQAVALVELARGNVPDATLETSIADRTNDINANPISYTLLGQEINDSTLIDTLKFLTETPIHVGPGPD
jgi:hypothetical protein